MSEKKNSTTNTESASVANIGTPNRRTPKKIGMRYEIKIYLAGAGSSAKGVNLGLIRSR